LTGWDIANPNDVAWAPWGARGDARAKLLATADGFNVAVVRAEAGYVGEPHVHDVPEVLYVIDGEVRTQGIVVPRGGGYAAAAGSVHEDFRTDAGATYLLIFKL
jgi:hypothetical protein